MRRLSVYLHIVDVIQQVLQGHGADLVLVLLGRLIRRRLLRLLHRRLGGSGWRTGAGAATVTGSSAGFGASRGTNRGMLPVEAGRMGCASSGGGLPSSSS